MASARAFVTSLADRVEVRAAAVFGSVARGDFNASSDVDLLVVADGLPRNYWQRLAALEAITPGVEPVVWTPDEWTRQRGRGNPIAVEAARDGVWLIEDAALGAAAGARPGSIRCRHPVTAVVTQPRQRAAGYGR